jgi:5-methylcytosine-specific restriction protein A
MAMPSKPKKPCKYQGCPKLTDGLFCEDHKQTENHRYNHYQRDPASGKRYGRAWRQIRAAFLSANPLCEICKREGKLTPADTVHHKKKLADGGNNYWGNLQSLCHSCHSRLHAEQHDSFD